MFKIEYEPDELTRSIRENPKIMDDYLEEKIKCFMRRNNSKFNDIKEPYIGIDIIDIFTAKVNNCNLSREEMTTINKFPRIVFDLMNCSDVTKDYNYKVINELDDNIINIKFIAGGYPMYCKRIKSEKISGAYNHTGNLIARATNDTTDNLSINKLPKYLEILELETGFNMRLPALPSTVIKLWILNPKYNKDIILNEGIEEFICSSDDNYNANIDVKSLLKIVYGGNIINKDIILNENSTDNIIIGSLKNIIYGEYIKKTAYSFPNKLYLENAEEFHYFGKSSFMLIGNKLKKVQLIMKDPLQKIVIKSVHDDCEIKLYLDNPKYIENIYFEQKIKNLVIVSDKFERYKINYGNKKIENLMISFNQMNIIDINIKSLSIAVLSIYIHGQQNMNRIKELSRIHGIKGLCYLPSSISFLEFERNAINIDDNEMYTKRNLSSTKINGSQLLNLPNKIVTLYMKNKVINKYFKIPQRVKFMCMNDIYIKYKYINIGSLKLIIDKHNMHKYNGTMGPIPWVDEESYLFSLNTLWLNALGNYLKNKNSIYDVDEIVQTFINSGWIGLEPHHKYTTVEKCKEYYIEQNRLIEIEIDNYKTQVNGKKIIYKAIHKQNIVKRNDKLKKFTCEEKNDDFIKKSDEFIDEISKHEKYIEEINFMIKVKKRGIIFDDEPLNIDFNNLKGYFPGNKFLSAMTSTDNEKYTKDDLK